MVYAYVVFEKSVQNFGKRSFGRPRNILDNNIKKDLKEIGLGVWIAFIWLRLVSGGELL
jgi:hypothetical protein